ncbi:hypothetical protein JTE90_021073 [Oedothorax gibbosus]|uniref:Uncharacterized protein n=1 Tax=Oedothorax gibbosus TaxID=931172 RepID=A0AAV6VUB2_9ARAC|nr:hypothetical protein JTE90_021073 [Oedothorax gibbosus]
MLSNISPLSQQHPKQHPTPQTKNKNKVLHKGDSTNGPSITMGQDQQPIVSRRNNGWGCTLPRTMFNDLLILPLNNRMHCSKWVFLLSYKGTGLLA